MTKLPPNRWMISKKSGVINTPQSPQVGGVLGKIIPFFAFPPDVRKIIYTTNAIESLNRVIRKTTKTRGSFPTDEAATKLIYLAIRNFEKNGRVVREWVAARNQFAILYPERFNR